MNYAFNHIEDMFSVMGKAGVQYLVLRNFDNLLEPEVYVDGHGDIDMLCYDSQQIVNLINAQPLTQDKLGMRGDGVHYFIEVGGKPVKLDLRYLGDGYYCTQWEQDMLDRRVARDCYFVLNEVDYFYSLIYHAILQKRSFSNEYRSRLLQMSKQLGLYVDDPSEKVFINLLQIYMRNKGYRFSYSQDYLVPNRFHLVDCRLVERNNALQWKHFLSDTKVNAIECLVKVKHFFTR